MITFERVCKTLTGKLILNNLSFTVEQGRRLMILGPSGSGKTTILRLIAGFDKPDKGKILINGLSGNRLSPYKRKVGMVFQDLALWPHMTVEENVGFCVQAKNNRQVKIKQALKEVGLIRHLNHYPSQLSGGEQQRLALARSLVNSPEILLLDEPLSHIDPLLREEIVKLIFDLQKESNLTLVYVTHNPAEAVRFSDRIIILHQGQIEQEGTREEVCANPKSEFVKKFLGL